MTKTDEFITKVEQLDPHLEVNKYHNLYDHDRNKTVMIIWYTTDNDNLMPIAAFTSVHDKLEFETFNSLFAEDVLVVYSKVVNLCAEYFSFLSKENK